MRGLWHGRGGHAAMPGGRDDRGPAALWTHAVLVAATVARAAPETWDRAGRPRPAGLCRRAREERLLPRERLARGRVDLDGDDLARPREAGEVDRLVVPRAATDARGVRARGGLDEDVERAADEPLRSLVRAALHDLDEALHALDLDVVRYDAFAERRGLRAAPRRVDERERAVVAHVL